MYLCCMCVFSFVLVGNAFCVALQHGKVLVIVEAFCGMCFSNRLWLIVSWPIVLSFLSQAITGHVCNLFAKNIVCVFSWLCYWWFSGLLSPLPPLFV